MSERTDASFRERVEAVVAQIPRGRVMTYGQLAALCGQPRAARIVGGIAHFGDPALPWQRVVNKKGGLAAGYPGGRAAHSEHLRAEDVAVSTDFYVDVEQLIWWPGKSGIGNRVPGIGPSDYNTLHPKPDPLVAIVGETASGKSALAMEIARKFNGEIVCADAWTVYKRFNIGTAKPSENDRAEVLHHVLDVADPTTGFSAAQFQQLAREAIAGIRSRGKLPILVGGSGLYVDSVVYNFSFIDSPNRSERDVLNTMTLAGLVGLAKERGLDTTGVDVQNKRRVIRLIENAGERGVRSPLPENVCIIGIETERSHLESRVKKRVDAMLTEGLEAEARSLSEQYGWDTEAMKGAGYLEWRAYFAGQATLAQTREAIIRSTMRLAKKQRTWFRRNKDVTWFSQPGEAVRFVGNWLNNTESKTAL